MRLVVTASPSSSVFCQSLQNKKLTPALYCKLLIPGKILMQSFPSMGLICEVAG
jgi:hypothetical protein